VQYIFRPIPPKGPVSEKSYLSGYGVTLDLKKMDYLSLDDRLAHRKSVSSDDDQRVRAEDEEVVLDRVLPYLERYPLNTTLGIGEPLTSDEIAREWTHDAYSVLYRTNFV